MLGQERPPGGDKVASSAEFPTFLFPLFPSHLRWNRRSSPDEPRLDAGDEGADRWLHYLPGGRHLQAGGADDSTTNAVRNRNEVRHGSKSKRRRGYGRKPRASCEVGRAAPEGHEDSSSRRRRVEPVAHIWSFRLPGAPARGEHFSSFWTSCPFRAPATRSRYCCCPQARRPEAGLG